MSMSLRYLVTLAAIFVPTSVFAAQKYWDRSLTILLAEGKEDCYFLPNIKETQEVDVEYQVRIYFLYFSYAEFYFLHFPPDDKRISVLELTSLFNCFAYLNIQHACLYHV